MTAHRAVAMGQPQAHGSAAKYAALGLGLAALWGSAARARADEPLTLSWQAPAACPQEPAVQAEVRRLLGGDATLGAGMHVAAHVAAASDGRLALTLIVRSAAGEATRTLEGATCESLTQAGALVVALAIDPEGVGARVAEAEGATSAPQTQTEALTATATTAETQTETVAESDTAADAAAETDTAAEAPTQPAADPPLRVRGRVFVHALTEALAVPGISGGLAAGGGLRVGIVDVTVEGLATAPRTRELATPPRATADFTLLAARLRGCVALTGSVVELAPCLGFEVGSLQGTSHEVSAPSSDSAPWFAPLVGAELRVFILDFVALTARIDATFPLVRPAFVIFIDGVRGVVTELGPASVRGELGASLYFP